MTLTPSSQAAISEVLQKIIGIYAGEEDQQISTDFYFLPQRETGSLIVLNDEDETIAQAAIPEWVNDDTDTFYDEVGEQLKAAISEANREGDLERLAVWMPYSFVLVDEERETICDLLLVDDDTLVVTNSLLQGLDEELNSFLEKLLED